MLASGNRTELQFNLVPASKQVAAAVWHIPVAVCTVLDSWCWTERPKHVECLFFHRACCYRTLFKNATHALCFKIHTKTQSLFKTLECLRLLCHPTCFGHKLDHLQEMFLVQCCFPSCCFVMCTSVLSVLLCDTTRPTAQRYIWQQHR